MQLRWKAIIMLGAVAFGIALLFFVISQLLLIRGFLNSEEQSTLQIANQMKSILQKELRELDTFNKDWSSWDDTYNFVLFPSRYSEYIVSNLEDLTFINARLDFIFIIDIQGKVVFSKHYDYEAQRSVPVSENELNLILNETILRTKDIKTTLSGIIKFPEDPLIISSQPILTTRGEGPVAGTIIMAQYLNAERISDLSNTLNLPLTLFKMEQSGIPQEIRSIYSLLSVEKPVLSRPVDSKTVAGYVLISDIYGSPVAMLKVSIDRFINSVGTDTIKYFMITVILVLAIFAPISYILMGKLVINKTLAINKYVQDIASSKDLTKRLVIQGHDEMSQLGANINAMIEKLQHTQKELAHINDQLKFYGQRIVRAQEEERKRVAYELHDDTAQYLSILKMQIGALTESEDIQNPKVREKLKFLERDADRAFNDVRRYSHELRPVVLEHQGLVAALEQIAEDYNKLGQFSVDVNIEGMEPDLSEEVKLGFFRVAQEALNNTRKHSKASRTNIKLRFDHMQMIIEDNGVGFNVQKAMEKSSGKGNLGLMSMRERADLINAELTIESEPGKGTRVILKDKLNPLK